VAEQTADALRREFAQDLAHEKVEHITLDPTVALVTVVGKNMRGSETVGRTFTALGRENVNIIAIAQGSSECNISFVVAKRDVGTALEAAHREFHLAAIETRAFPVKGVAVTAPAWECEPETRTAGD
jgi:bifunctional aspartokinase / homoserine dehydrogenase 1